MRKYKCSGIIAYNSVILTDLSMKSKMISSWGKSCLLSYHVRIMTLWLKYFCVCPYVVFSSFFSRFSQKKNTTHDCPNIQFLCAISPMEFPFLTWSLHFFNCKEKRKPTQHLDLNCHAGRHIHFLIVDAYNIPIQEIPYIKIQTKIKNEIVMTAITIWLNSSTRIHAKLKMWGSSETSWSPI